MDTGNSNENSHPILETPPRAERVSFWYTIINFNFSRFLYYFSSQKSTRGSRQKGVDSVTKKFLRNFDPEHSEREKRKLHRRLYQGHKRHVMYDENGVYTQTGDDLCDCLNLNCAGCHFSCPKCNSPKCGHECRYDIKKLFFKFIYFLNIKNKFFIRNNRKWTYESIENEGSDIIIKNPLLKETWSSKIKSVK